MQPTQDENKRAKPVGQVMTDFGFQPDELSSSQARIDWWINRQARISALIKRLRELDAEYNHALGNALSDIADYRVTLSRRVDVADSRDELVFMGIIGRNWDDEFKSQQRENPALDESDYYPELHRLAYGAVLSASVEHLEEYALRTSQGQVLKEYIAATGQRLRDKLLDVLYEHDAKASDYLIDLFCKLPKERFSNDGKEAKTAVPAEQDDAALATPTLSAAISSALVEQKVEIPDVLSDLIAGLALNVRAEEAVRCVFAATAGEGAPFRNLPTSKQAAVSAIAAQRHETKAAGAGAGAGASRKRTATSAFGGSREPSSKRARTMVAAAAASSSLSDDSDDDEEQDKAPAVATPTASIDWNARLQAEANERNQQSEELRQYIAASVGAGSAPGGAVFSTVMTEQDLGSTSMELGEEDKGDLTQGSS